MTKTKEPKRTRRMARMPAQAVPVNESHSEAEPSLSHKAPTATAKAASKASTKAATVVDLLKQPQGASLDELVAATDWLPHTARAALTNLRKKGHSILRTKADGVSRYAITPVGQS